MAEQFSHLSQQRVDWDMQHGRYPGRPCWPDGMTAFVFGSLGIVLDREARLVAVRLLCGRV